MQKFKAPFLKFLAHLWPYTAPRKKDIRINNETFFCQLSVWEEFPFQRFLWCLFYSEGITLFADNLVKGDENSFVTFLDESDFLHSIMLKLIVFNFISVAKKLRLNIQQLWGILTFRLVSTGILFLPGEAYLSYSLTKF